MGRKNELVVSCPSEYQQAVVRQSRGPLRELSVTIIVDTPQRQLGLFINKTPKVKAVFVYWVLIVWLGSRETVSFKILTKPQPSKQDSCLSEKQKMLFKALNLLCVYLYVCMCTHVCKSLGEDVTCPLPCSLLSPWRNFFTQPGLHCFSAKLVAKQLHCLSRLPCLQHWSHQNMRTCRALCGCCGSELRSELSSSTESSLWVPSSREMRLQYFSISRREKWRTSLKHLWSNEAGP